VRSGRRRVSPVDALLTGALLAALAACSGPGAGAVVTAPEPAASPVPTAAPAGRVLPSGPVSALAVDPVTGTLAVAVTGPDRVLLHELAGLAAPARSVGLPGPATALSTVGGTLLVAAGVLTEVDLPRGAPATVRPGGSVRDAVAVGDSTVVALGSQIAVLDARGEVLRTVAGFADAARLVVTGDGVVVLDRGRTALSVLDPAAGEAGPALRAGEGATAAVGDRFGRTLVLDTRDGELLVFAGDPLLLRQRYPVSGSPYGIAYDARRDLAWVTLPARNEVVGLDVAGGEPVERYRFPTVRQPDSVAVDPGSGQVFVGSASGAGLQVVDPGQVVAR